MAWLCGRAVALLIDGWAVRAERIAERGPYAPVLASNAVSALGSTPAMPLPATSRCNAKISRLTLVTGAEVVHRTRAGRWAMA